MAFAKQICINQLHINNFNIADEVADLLSEFKANNVEIKI
jgi:hypothetical protein